MTKKFNYFVSSNNYNLKMFNWVEKKFNSNSLSICIIVKGKLMYLYKFI